MSVFVNIHMWHVRVKRKLHLPETFTVLRRQYYRQFIAKKQNKTKKNLSVSSLLAEKHLIIMLNFIQMGSAGSEQLFVVSFLAA